MQLFVPLLAALILDAALADKVPECVNKQNPTLCHLLLWTYQLTEALGDILQGSCSLEAVKEGASLANKAVTRALNTTDEKRCSIGIKKSGMRIREKPYALPTAETNKPAEQGHCDYLARK
ncbi:hypothetical protein Q1695_004374 [Nippostrongylus brasiliensis]|nr:hypothetical protein Q1695_004374 [Nippostrongylus brasiliensis]